MRRFGGREKKYIERLRMWIRGCSMRQKMTIAFSVPIIAISFLTYLAAGSYMQRRFTQQLQYSTEQALAQAGNFLTSYVQNMQYISDQIRASTSLQEVLAEPEFGNRLEVKESYLEFYQLNQIFAQIELSNGDYRIGMYVPDRALYSGNNYYFYPESELEKRDDYARIQAELDSGRAVYCIVMDKRTGDPDSTQEYLARLSNITVDCADGEQRRFTIKVEEIGRASCRERV